MNSATNANESVVSRSVAGNLSSQLTKQETTTSMLRDMPLRLWQMPKQQACPMKRKSDWENCKD